MGLPLSADDWPPGRIHTERLLLRAPEAGDRDAFLDLGSDAEVNRHLGGAQDRTELERTLPEVPADRPAQYVMTHADGFVGWVGLSRREPSRPGRVAAAGGDLELSYVLPVHAWGHGYGAEACAALLARADELLAEPVVLCTQVANTRSRALAERLGFVEVTRFEEFGAEQWFGVRQAGRVTTPSPAPADLRRATSADVPALGRIASEAYSPYLPRMGGLRPGPMDTDYAATVSGSETWVALVDGEPVGFLVLVVEHDAMLLENVAVRPSHHGRGIGGQLLAVAEERATAAGCPRIRLYTHVSMVENQALYERRGYVETHRGGEAGLVRVFYQKWLREAVPPDS